MGSFVSIFNHFLITFLSCVIVPIAGLDYSVSGNVVTVSGYPSSEDIDEDYVLMVFENIDDRARIVS
jgi:hypothetical protein